MKKNLISASLLAADKSRLAEELHRIENSGIELIHFDVMDHLFVPNLSFFDDTFSTIRAFASLPFEIHLMVEHPEDFIDRYGDRKEDVIIVHYEGFESEDQLEICLKNIRKKHRAGISLKPGTDVRVLDRFLSDVDYVLVMSVEPGFGGQKFQPSALEKIRYLKERQKDHKYLIEVDGGINAETAESCVRAGCDILVSGSYLFSGDMKENAEAIRCGR